MVAGVRLLNISLCLCMLVFACVCLYTGYVQWRWYLFVPLIWLSTALYLSLG